MALITYEDKDSSLPAGSPNVKKKIRDVDLNEDVSGSEADTIDYLEISNNQIRNFVTTGIDNSTAGTGDLIINKLIIKGNTIPTSGGNLIFTLANTPITGSVELHNVIYMVPTVDYTISGNTITFVVAPETDSNPIANYRK